MDRLAAEAVANSQVYVRVTVKNGDVLVIDRAQKAPIDNVVGTIKLIAACSVGTIFEWYDFFIFGALASIIASKFFVGVNDATAFIFALGAFGAGFAFRPLGALVFGRVGDLLGRKSAFLWTIVLMGGATIGIGLLPTYGQIGAFAPALLIALRIIQGFALGGEYGGAATFVAEHAPNGRRGEYTGWIQISASLGLLGALAAVYISRTIMGEQAFSVWGWRIPFLLSAGLLMISLWMRSSLGESPAFKLMQGRGLESRSPIKDAFLNWKNLRIVLIVLFGFMAAQGALWNTVFFYAQFFMEKILKLNPSRVNLLMIAITLTSAPLYVVFGWLSDRVGRKPVMLGGMMVGAIAIIPMFHIITLAGNPALAVATQSIPVKVVATAGECSLQIDPLGRRQYFTACDIANSVLANAGISYSNEVAPPGMESYVRIGERVIKLQSASDVQTMESRQIKEDVSRSIKSALRNAGYPMSADPARVNWLMLFIALTMLVVCATALYGPMAATLTELFPTQIRYTAMSLPYNIGTGWFGGFLPFIIFTMVAANGNIYFGLWYPVVVIALSIGISFWFLPETVGRSLDFAETRAALLDKR